MVVLENSLIDVSASKKLLQKKNEKLNFQIELTLFHGTKENPPENIYNNEMGFDIKYASKGMWGRAIYFAYNAKYSDGYAHK